MRFFLIKTEPDDFSYQDLEQLDFERWNGVHSLVALKYMRQIKPGDLIFIYHTGKQKAIFGVGEAVSSPYPDPTEQDDKYIVFDVKARYRLARPVTLKEIKQNPAFSDWLLTKSPRLSVMPVSQGEWDLIHQLAKE